MSKSEEIETYIRLLDEGKNEEALALKTSILPKSLFKYQSLSANTLNCLDKSSVWVSKVLNQNDPFECPLTFIDKEYALAVYESPNFKNEFQNIYGTDISDSEVSEILHSNEPELKFREICKRKNVNRDFDDPTEIRERVANFFLQKQSGIVMSCFSERKDSILMWSHYAGKHQGICVEYDFSGDDYVLNFIEPVWYTNQLFSISKAFANRTKNSDQIRIAAITKAIDWQYEKEWRVVFPNSSEGHFKVPKPIRIYVGARFNQHLDSGLKNSFIMKCKELEIPICPMRLSPTEFKIIE
jgi:hypothetical protein